MLQETQPEVMDVIEDRGDTFDLVRQGMIGVSETVSGLKNYPVTIACKSGTPQRSETYYVGSTRKHYTNTMMIAYGPAEDPQIALGIVIEYGGGGARAGNLVADIFDAYYAMKDGSLTLDETGAGETADTDDSRTGRMLCRRLCRRLWKTTTPLQTTPPPQNSLSPERWCVDLAESYEKLELLPEKQL